MSELFCSYVEETGGVLGRRLDQRYLRLGVPAQISAFKTFGWGLTKSFKGILKEVYHKIRKAYSISLNSNYLTLLDIAGDVVAHW